MSDEVKLVLPAQEDFRPIVHLVVGGLAARLDLTFDTLEDVQLALGALLARREDERDVVLTLELGETVRITLGPFEAAALADLEEDGSGLGLRRVLDTVCDTVEVDKRDDGAWVELTKRAVAPARSGG
jgi:anti-sigma regulatory factor (Ser/Thr protein kinase)